MIVRPGDLITPKKPFVNVPVYKSVWDRWALEGGELQFIRSLVHDAGGFMSFGDVGFVVACTDYGAERIEHKRKIAYVFVNQTLGGWIYVNEYVERNFDIVHGESSCLTM